MTSKKKVILIIEDESMLQEALIENLTDEGFEVYGSEDCASAFERAREVRPDVILTDLVLPGPDGFEIIRMMKEDFSLRTIPILVLSNRGEKEDIDRAKSLGADDFFVKSDLSLSEVTEKVKKALSKLD